MRYNMSLATLSLGLTAVLAARAAGQPLTIYEIQSNTIDGDASTYGGSVINCAGGICVGKFPGFRPRLILQDPSAPDAWGGIQVKDWIYPFDMYNDVQIGDWVSLTNVLVEEYVGTTFLQRQSAYSPEYEIVSQGNPLPPPVLVSPSEIAAPLHYPSDNAWRVADHQAELYESMRLIVRDVTVTQMNLGKAVDNYNLRDPSGAECWAADYMNEDVELWGYHPFVTVDQHFCAVAGVFEQYTSLPRWDYYQLVTLYTVDLAICGDGDSDGSVTPADWPRCEECFTGPQCDELPGGCDPPAWTSAPLDLSVQHCLMMDFDYDGDADMSDFAELQLACGSR